MGHDLGFKGLSIVQKSISIWLSELYKVSYSDAPLGINVNAFATAFNFESMAASHAILSPPYQDVNNKLYDDNLVECMIKIVRDPSSGSFDGKLDLIEYRLMNYIKAFNDSDLFGNMVIDKLRRAISAPMPVHAYKGDLKADISRIDGDIFFQEGFCEILELAKHILSELGNGTSANHILESIHVNKKLMDIFNRDDAKEYLKDVEVSHLKLLLDLQTKKLKPRRRLPNENENQTSSQQSNTSLSDEFSSVGPKLIAVSIDGTVRGKFKLDLHKNHLEIISQINDSKELLRLIDGKNFKILSVIPDLILKIETLSPANDLESLSKLDFIKDEPLPIDKSLPPLLHPPRGKDVMVKMERKVMLGALLKSFAWLIIPVLTVGSILCFQEEVYWGLGLCLFFSLGSYIHFKDLYDQKVKELRDDERDRKIYAKKRLLQGIINSVRFDFSKLVKIPANIKGIKRSTSRPCKFCKRYIMNYTRLYVSFVPITNEHVVCMHCVRSRESIGRSQPRSKYLDEIEYFETYVKAKKIFTSEVHGIALTKGKGQFNLKEISESFDQELLKAIESW